MTEQKKPHICRKCGHLGAPNWNDWDMVEHKQDGSKSEWSGSTPRCTECNAIVRTKREWWSYDYEQKNFTRTFVGMVLIPLFILPIGFMLTDGEWWADVFCLLILSFFIGTVISLEVGKRRYIRICEEE